VPTTLDHLKRSSETIGSELSAAGLGRAPVRDRGLDRSQPTPPNFWVSKPARICIAGKPENERP
jgi:hypothetical protein